MSMSSFSQNIPYLLLLGVQPLGGVSLCAFNEHGKRKLCFVNVCFDGVKKSGPFMGNTVLERRLLFRKYEKVVSSLKRPQFYV